MDARRAGQAADDYTVYTVGYLADYRFRVCVENVEICQTDGGRIVFTADG